MNKDYLIELAQSLKQVKVSTADEYKKKSSQLVTKMNSLMEERADIKKLVGEHNLDMMKDNHSNHARFISTIIKNYNAEVFVDTVLWVFNAYMNHGFSTNYWAAQLNNWIIILKDELDKSSFEEIYPFYEWMQTNIPVFVKLSAKLEDTPPPDHSI